MKRYIVKMFVIALVAFIFWGSFAHADDLDDARVRLAISPNGSVEAKGAKVIGISGNTINVSSTWSSFTINWTVQTNSETKFHRLHGVPSSLGEIVVGNTLNVGGLLVTSASSTTPTVLAKRVRDVSVRRLSMGRGTIASINSSAKTFVLSRPNKTDVTVVVSDTTKIKKGKQVITFSDLKVSDKVLASGVFDSSTHMLTAQSILTAK